MIGQKFSRLLVVAPDKPKHGRAYWICECECGQRCSASGKALRSGKKRSCGCLRRELARDRAAVLSENNRLAFGEAGFNLLYATYRCSAETRKLDFELSKCDFKSLTSGICVYCGSEPSQYCGKETSGFYVYNWIDRKDNTKGYTLENSVSCCGRCNLMKRFMSPAQFIDACKAVVDHFSKK